MKIVNRIKNAIRKGYSYSFASKLNRLEFALMIVSILIPIIYYIDNIYVMLMYISVVISMILSVKDQYFQQKKHWSKFYRNTFWAVVALQTLNFLLFMGSNYKLFSLITLSVGLIIYFVLTFSLCIFLLNIGFWIVLKFIFPFEATNSLEINDTRLKELSKQMSLNEQIIYFITMVLHVLMRYGVAVYIYLLGLIYTKDWQESEELLTLIEKVEKLDVFSIGNLLGVVSIVIAVATVTLQEQLKIEKIAHEKLRGGNKSSSS